MRDLFKSASTLSCTSLLLVSLLTGCVYYGDIHGDSHQYDLSDVAQPHTYSHPTPVAETKPGWWDKFHDPQLNQLITVALSDSPKMKMAESRIRNAQHLAEAAGASLWPAVDLSGSSERAKFPKYGLIPPPFNNKVFTINDVALNLNYDFDFWGKNSQTLKARLGEVLAAQADLNAAQLALSSAVANVYFELLNDVVQVKLAQARWDLNKQRLQIASDRLQHGIRSEIPINTINLDTQLAMQAVEKYKQDELLARHQLSVLLGKNPFNTDIETQQFTYHPYQVSLPASLPANLLANRPDIQATKFRAEAAAHDINVAKAQFFPDINLNLLFSYQSVISNQLFKSSSQYKGITGAFDLPIFDAGARRANLGMKYAEYDLAVNDYNQTLLTALREVADQLSNLQTLKPQIKAQTISLNSIQRNYTLYRARYRQGIADYDDLLGIKDTLLTQQADLINLQIRHLQTLVAMLRALGGQDV
jgi:NodT family efflux transporter outer membrane factor (OMF) lipoprotein